MRIPLASRWSASPGKLKGLGPAIFYAESVSIVEFMIEEHGSTNFRKFCGELKNGKSVDDALRFTYPGSIGSIGALEKAWLKYLEGTK